MLLYKTGKLPPSVYGWGLSDRGDYLYFTTRTHATVRSQGKARKGGLFKTKHFIFHFPLQLNKTRWRREEVDG